MSVTTTTMYINESQVSGPLKDGAAGVQKHDEHGQSGVYGWLGSMRSYRQRFELLSIRVSIRTKCNATAAWSEVPARILKAALLPHPPKVGRKGVRDG